eukprot:TRINITY_DN96852_c0_g1_i1.p1 TRINITY_DN96852_c0_g1~~TRINITY_DN96852_c0_g1_i1.p1  ORF type:complete len:259 (-),score=19.62 TRINITY_DN96852_c0_g1_i1:38-772(-)
MRADEPTQGSSSEVLHCEASGHFQDPTMTDVQCIANQCLACSDKTPVLFTCQECAQAYNLCVRCLSAGHSCRFCAAEASFSDTSWDLSLLEASDASSFYAGTPHTKEAQPSPKPSRKQETPLSLRSRRSARYRFSSCRGEAPREVQMEAKMQRSQSAPAKLDFSARERRNHKRVSFVKGLDYYQAWEAHWRSRGGRSVGDPMTPRPDQTYSTFTKEYNFWRAQLLDKLEKRNSKKIEKPGRLVR